MARVNKYVSTTATGTGDGSSGDPWTPYQAAANATSADVILVRPGTYTLATQVLNTKVGTYYLWVGVDGSDNPVGYWDTASLPVFDFTTQVSGSFSFYNNQPLKLYGIHIKNGLNTDIYSTTSLTVVNSIIEGAGTRGIEGSSTSRILYSKIINNTTYGLYLNVTSASCYGCTFIDNPDNLISGITSNSIFIDTASNVTTHLSTNGGIAINNSFYGGTTAISASSGNEDDINNAIVNSTNGISSGTYGLRVNNTAYNCTTAYSSGDNINDMTTNPQFTDPTNGDFSLGEASFVDYYTPTNLNLGADQTSGGSSGGIIVHTGMNGGVL